MGASDATIPFERVVPADAPLGCLLIHGLTGTPEEMTPVARALAGRYPLWVARVAGHDADLTGHGGSSAALAATSWREWYASVVAGADALARSVPQLVPIGLSMGALLALRLAIERPHAIAGLVLLSPATAVRRGSAGWMRHPLRLLSRADGRSPLVQAMLARVFFAKDGSDIADLEVRARHPGYRRVPFRALLNLLALQRDVLPHLERVTHPALIVHALQDHTCPVEGARLLYERLGSQPKRLVLLDKSFHVVTVDRERDRVIGEIETFLAGLAARPAPAVPARSS